MVLSWNVIMLTIYTIWSKKILNTRVSCTPHICDSLHIPKLFNILHSLRERRPLYYVYNLKKIHRLSKRWLRLSQIKKVEEGWWKKVNRQDCCYRETERGESSANIWDYHGDDKFILARNQNDSYPHTGESKTIFCNRFPDTFTWYITHAVTKYVTLNMGSEKTQRNAIPHWMLTL